MDIVQKEYTSDAKLKKEDVKMLHEWVESQPHLPKMTEQEVIWFLKSCYYSNEAAKTTIDNYFTMRMLGPEILRNRDVKSLENSMEAMQFSVLPKRTPEGYTVYLVIYKDPNPDNFNFNEAIKLFDMVAMADLFTNGTHEGLMCCVDIKSVSFGHLAKLGIVSVKKILIYLQEGMPIRLKGMHYFNTSPIMDKILMLMKPFLKKEVLEMIHLHQTVQDMEKFVPLECLPSDYGGKGDSLAVLHDKMKQTLRDNVEFFAYQDSQLVDESKRPGKPKSSSEIFGVQGTFKKLTLD